MANPSPESVRAAGVQGLPWDGRDYTVRLAKPGSSLPFTDPSGAVINALNEDQNQALWQIEQANGGLILVAVGGGKAGVSLLAGSVLEGVKKVLIFTPASTVGQLVATHSEWKNRFTMVQDIDILSFHTLSQPRLENETPLIDSLIEGYEGSEILIVADEVHKLGNPKAARTLRMDRFLRGLPGARFIGLSGSIMRKSIRDFAHIAEWALRGNTPLPRGPVLKSWARCIDLEAEPFAKDYPQIAPLTGRYGVKSRPAFGLHLRQARGVHCSPSAKVSAELHIKRLKIGVPEEVKAALKLVESGTNPKGDVLVTDVELWRAQRQLSCGFYYYWDWPDGVPDFEWLDARGEWAAAIRDVLDKEARHGFDSPKLLETAARAGQGPRNLVEAWQGWELVKDREPPPTKTAWVSDFFLDHIQQICDTGFKKSERFVLWCYSDALRNRLRERGLTVYGAGDDIPTSERGICAMSIKAHGVGLNLQRWSKALVLEPPSSGSEWEQLLGRHHRPGQKEKIVYVGVMGHTRIFSESLAKARQQARDLELKLGKQKLNLAKFL